MDFLIDENNYMVFGLQQKIYSKVKCKKMKLRSREFSFLLSFAIAFKIMLLFQYQISILGKNGNLLFFSKFPRVIWKRHIF